MAAAIGRDIGLLIARFASALLQRLTYEVELNTWMTGVPSAALMLLIPLASVGLTARRALRPNLVTVLRQRRCDTATWNTDFARSTAMVACPKGTPPCRGLNRPFTVGTMMPHGRRSPCHRLQPTAASAILSRRG